MEQSKHRDNQAIAIPLAILAALALGFLVKEASVVTLWLICSFTIFALVDPWIQRLSARGVAPLLSALVLVTFVMAAFVAAVALFYRSFPGIALEFTGYWNTIMHIYQSAVQRLPEWAQAPFIGAGPDAATGAAGAHSQEQAMSPELMSSPTAMLEAMLHGLGSFLTIFSFIILCPILTIFMIMERNGFASVFSRRLFRSGEGERAWIKITSATGAFFLGNFVLLLISIPVFWLLFKLFGVPQPLTLAVLASVFNLIPFLGAILTGLLPVLSILSHEGSVTGAVGLFACCVAAHFTVANMVTPKILGSRVDLNATASTIALIALGELLGGLGLLLAIPVCATLKILLEHSGNRTLETVAELMSERPMRTEPVTTKTNVVTTQPVGAPA